jgi:hypothetical protein
MPIPDIIERRMAGGKISVPAVKKQKTDVDKGSGIGSGSGSGRLRS